MDGQLESLQIVEARPTVAVGGFGVSWLDFGLIWLGATCLLLLIAFSAEFSSLAAVRLVLGLLYVLYVPGYCLSAALFPGKDELDGIERTGLSIGLSIAIVPLLALILKPWGLHLWPILVAEYSVMALCTGVALRRRARLPIETAHAPKWWRPWRWWRSLPALEKRIYLLLVGMLLMAGIAVGRVFLLPSPDEFTTEFYILGREGLAEDYPRQAALGEEVTVSMGIINREQGEHHYRIEVWGINPWQADAPKKALYTEQIDLLPYKGREFPLTWSMPSVGDDQKVEFLLFIDDNPEPYRQLRLWLNVVQDAN